MSPDLYPAPITRHILKAGLWGAVVGGLFWAGWQVLAGPDLSALPHMVAVARPNQPDFYVQVDEVTVAEWNRCHAAGGCDLHLSVPQGDSGTDFPATGLNYGDVQQYLRWLNARTNHGFRLPTAQEWRGLAQDVLPESPDPIFTDPNLSWASAYLIQPEISRQLVPTGAFSTSAAGLRDLDGNVWEWTQDCYAGSATVSPGRCPAYYVQGLHEAAMSYLVRDPARGGCAVGSPPAHLGFRLVSERPIPNQRGTALD